MSIPENLTDPSHVVVDWEEASVRYFKRDFGEQKVFRRPETIDNRDRQNPIRYYHDKVEDIALKCFLMFLFLPVYTMAVMATHSIRCLTLALSNLGKEEYSEAFLSIVQEVWAVVKAPFYCIAFEFYALAGMLFPLPMRPVIAQLERAWSGSERQYDFLRKNGCLEEYFTDRASKLTVFLAFCFQPYGELKDGTRVYNYAFV